MYFPIAQTPYGAPLLWPQYLVVRTTAETAAIAPMLRAAVAEVDHNQPVADVQTMDDMLDTETLTQRTQMTLLGGFAAIALILAAAGLYGVLAYTVAQRTSEIGLRMALGAQRHEAAAGVVKNALWLAGVGIAIGLGVAWSLGRALSSVLFEVSPTDPLTFGVVISVLAVVAMLACFITARRAANVDPVIALRHE
jgi:putative ABC transport system permease protein